jgi:hypothetical protein
MAGVKTILARCFLKFFFDQKSGCPGLRQNPRLTLGHSVSRKGVRGFLGCRHFLNNNLVFDFFLVHLFRSPRERTVDHAFTPRNQGVACRRVMQVAKTLVPAH